MPGELIIMGARVRVYNPVILAASENFAIATVSKEIDEAIPSRVLDLVERALSGGEISEGDPLHSVMAKAILYGGVVLFHTYEGEAIPLSRLYIKGGFTFNPGCNGPGKTSDSLVLEAWRALYKGRVKRALEAIGWCSYQPRYNLGYDPQGELLPVGYETIL